MGEIRKQGVSNSIILYLGFLLGYVNIVMLFPRYFSEEEFGLTRLLLSFSQIVSIIAQLGFSNIILKYFPYFNKDRDSFSGFLFFVFFAPFVGFVVISAIFYGIHPLVFEIYEGGSLILTKHYYWIFPLAFFQIYFDAFAAYARSLYNAVLPIFLKEVVVRLIVMASILLASFEIITFQAFLCFFVFANAAPAIGLFSYFLGKKVFTLKPHFNFFNRGLLKEMLIYGFFTMSNSFSSILNQRLDILMLAALSNIKDVAVYTIAFLIGSIITLPNRGLIQIAAPKLANAFAKNQKSEIRNIYKKSALNEFIIGGLIFVVIWSSINPMLETINPDYLRAKYVVFFIGLAKLLNACASTNNLLLQHSRFFRFNMYFLIMNLVLTATFNLLLIPKFNIVGAAITTTLSSFFTNFLRVSLIWKKLSYHPFSIGMISAIIIMLLAAFVGYVVPDLKLESGAWRNVLEILYKSCVITLVYVMGVIILKPSEDIEAIKKELLRRFWS